MQLRFTPPAGLKNDFLGSFIGSLVEYKEYVEGGGANIGYETWMSQEIDTHQNNMRGITTPSPPPQPRSIEHEYDKSIIRSNAKKRRGYMSTVLTGGINLGTVGTSSEKAKRLG